MKLRTLIATLAILTLVSGVAYAAGKFSVKASEFDPANTFLVQAQWLDGIGCPTNAKVSADGATTTSHYTDAACATGDSSDSHNQGLLLAKTGPTANFASAGADITGVKGITLTELGYDVRKPGVDTRAGARGSHCGAGAPRFNVTTADGITYDFIGCNSGATPATSEVDGQGWIRLRWGAGSILAFAANGPAAGTVVNISGMTVKSIQIVFDEGQDTGPDNFGLAVLDNVDINGTLVGQGDNADNKKDKNKDKNHGENGDDNNDQGEND
ncbi:MAG: hypothetical protein AABM40_11080 [Chloroflexota bacterium]